MQAGWDRGFHAREGPATMLAGRQEGFHAREGMDSENAGRQAGMEVFALGKGQREC